MIATGTRTTGEIAAWLFGVANFPVALSILLKTSSKFFLPANVKDPITRFNRQQKKNLMAESHCTGHCSDALHALHVQINGNAGMGIGDHTRHRPPWFDNEIQAVSTIDAAKNLQISHKSCFVDHRHFDFADRA